MNDSEIIPEYFLIFEDKGPYEVVPLESGVRLPVMAKYSKLRLINQYIKTLPFCMTFDDYFFQVKDIRIDRDNKTIDLELIKHIPESNNPS